MPKTIVQKNVRRNGSLAQGSMSFHVTGGDTIAGADFEMTPGDGADPALITFIPRYIDKVVVTSGSAVTIDGNSYATGTWDFYDVGGVPTSGAVVTVGAGNVLIKFRS